MKIERKDINIYLIVSLGFLLLFSVVGLFGEVNAPGYDGVERKPAGWYHEAAKLK